VFFKDLWWQHNKEKKHDKNLNNEGMFDIDTAQGHINYFHPDFKFTFQALRQSVIK
jgi:hypothetical protein